jgi:prepilin-type N-terminal cleavage/methylation domain-containing protein
MKRQLRAASDKLREKYRFFSFLMPASLCLEARRSKLAAIRGFSAIEVLIVIAVSSLIMLALSNIFVTYYDSYAYQNAYINTSVSATTFLNDMNDLSLQASEIVSSHAFAGVTYTTGSTTVVFEIPSVNSSGEILANTSDYAVLFSSTTKLYRIMDADASSARLDGTKQFTDVLQNLTLTYNNPTPSSASNIVVNVLTQSTAKGKTATTHLMQTVYLRNKE